MATRRQPAMRARKTRLDSGLQTKKRKIHNESSCSSPADGAPRSPADYTCTSPDEESSTFHSSTCRLDSGQQPHPRNMEDEIDSLDKKIIAVIGTISSCYTMSDGWYHGAGGMGLIFYRISVVEEYKHVTIEMIKERIEKLEQMVEDFCEKRRPSLPHEKPMLYVFRGYEIIAPETPLNSGKRATLVSEELEAPSTKRARSESVNMAMYLSNPDAASKLLKGGLGMDDCTTRAEYLLHDSHMLYPAITLLRKNIEIRQSFMTFGDSHAHGYIEYELKQHGML